MKYLSFLTCFLFPFVHYGQDTLLFNGENGRLQDAWVWSFPVAANSNFGAYNASAPDFHKVVRAESWQWQEGRSDTIRGFMQFDLGLLKANNILKAELDLWHYSNPRFTKQVGANALDLHLVTEAWSEDQVTWTNQPDFEKEPLAQFGASTDQSQDYDGLDVTELIKAYVEAKAEGIVLKLNGEKPFAGLSFASKEHPNPELRPVLRVVVKKANATTFEGHSAFQCQYQPDGQVLTLTSTGIETGSVTVWNAQGQPVWSGHWPSASTAHRFQLPVAASGLYLVTVQNEKQLLRSRFWVN